MNKEIDLISIIVPVYQVENYLERCLESILKQTYSNFEVILIDDGSKDQSANICEKYAQKDSRIRVFHKENGGLASARNKGIERANGDWYCFIDSDDYIKEDYLEYLLNLCIKNNADISCCNYDIVYEDISNVDKNIKLDEQESNQIYSSEKFTYLLICDKIANYAWNKLYRSTLWKNFRFDENYRIYEDMVTLYKVAAEGRKAVFGCEAKYFYVQRSSSLLHTNKELGNLLDYFNVLENQEQYINNNHICTSKNVPFKLLKIENYRRYINYCIEHNEKINFKIKDMTNILKDKKQIIKFFFYRDIFDIKSIISNIILLFSIDLYVKQRIKRNKTNNK